MIDRRAVARALIWSLTTTVLGAAALALSGTGFVNYDTLYGLLWGSDAARGAEPELRLPLAPTPKPLLTIVGIALSPLDPATAQSVVVVVAFVSLGALALVAGQIACLLAGRVAAALTIAIVLTSVPVLSFGARAYVDIPYAALVLAAVALELRRPRAGLPVLGLLGIAGLLRPEAWLLAGAYGVYCAWGRDRLVFVTVALAVATAPALWLLHDLLLAGDPLWSLNGTRATADALDRPTGVLDAFRLAPRRIGEIVREPVLLAAGLGAAVALAQRGRAITTVAIALVLTLISFVVLAGAGLPALGRYLLAPALLVVVTGASGLVMTVRRGGGWLAAGVVVTLAFLAFTPAQVDRLNALRRTLQAQQRAFSEAEALVTRPAVRASCGPLSIPDHRLRPLLALRLGRRASSVSSRFGTHGSFVVPRSARVARMTLLVPRPTAGPRNPVGPPGGSRLVAANRSWSVYERC